MLMSSASLLSALGVLQLVSTASAVVNLFVFGPQVAPNSVVQFDPTSYTSADAHLAAIGPATNIEQDYDLYYWTINSTGPFNRNYYAHPGGTVQGELVFIPYGASIDGAPISTQLQYGWSVQSDGTVTALSDPAFGPAMYQQFWACSNSTAPGGDKNTAIAGQYLALRNPGMENPGCTPISLNVNSLGPNATSSSTQLTRSPTGSLSTRTTSGIYSNTSSTYPIPSTDMPIETYPVPTKSAPIGTSPLPSTNTPIETSPLPSTNTPIETSPLPSTNTPIEASPFPSVFTTVSQTTTYTTVFSGTPTTIITVVPVTTVVGNTVAAAGTTVVYSVTGVDGQFTTLTTVVVPVSTTNAPSQNTPAGNTGMLGQQLGAAQTSLAANGNTQGTSLPAQTTNSGTKSLVSVTLITTLSGLLVLAVV